MFDFAYFFSIFVICLLIMTIMFSRQEDKEKQEILKNTSERVTTGIENYFEKIDLDAYTLMYSKWVQQMMNDNTFSTKAEKDDYQKNASHFLSSFSTMTGDLACMLILQDHSFVKSSNGFNINPNFKIENQEWYDDLIQQKKYIEFGCSSIAKKENSLTCYYVITGIYDFREKGYFALNIEYSQFDFIREMINEGEYIVLRDQDNKIVYTNVEEDSSLNTGNQKESISKKEFYMFKCSTMDGKWSLLVSARKGTVFGGISRNLVTIGTMVPVACIFMLLSLIFSGYLTEPIVMCTNALREVQNRKFDLVIPNKYHDEIGDMIEGFNEMARNIKQLISQNQLIFESRRQAEIKILQQRMNPHFLCNTLEIINGMILCGDLNKAVELTEMMGKMYRYDLGNEDLVSVREEVFYLDNYLNILSYKFRNLQVDLKVEQEVMDCNVLRFVCQPLVENSIKHGFKRKRTDCKILIQLYKVEGMFHILVADNGCGMNLESQEKLKKEINNLRENQGIEITEHIGILNTARRVFLQYGSLCVFDINSVENAGFSIHISFRS